MPLWIQIFILFIFYFGRVYTGKFYAYSEYLQGAILQEIVGRKRPWFPHPAGDTPSDQLHDVHYAAVTSSSSVWSLLDCPFLSWSSISVALFT